MPLSLDVLPLYVVETEQDEPFTVKVEEIPIAETIPSGWQMQVVVPASSLDEQQTFAPLPPPLLLLLHAATSPTNTTTTADVIRFIEEDPLSTGFRSFSPLAESRQGAFASDWCATGVRMVQ